MSRAALVRPIIHFARTPAGQAEIALAVANRSGPFTVSTREGRGWRCHSSDASAADVPQICNATAADGGHPCVFDADGVQVWPA